MHGCLTFRAHYRYNTGTELLGATRTKSAYLIIQLLRTMMFITPCLVAWRGGAQYSQTNFMGSHEVGDDNKVCVGIPIDGDHGELMKKIMWTKQRSIDDRGSSLKVRELGHATQEKMRTKLV